MPDIGDFIRRSPRSAYKIVDIWHVRYRRLNSPAFAKCARSRDFLRSSLRIASEVNPSGWAILSHDFSKLPHRRDRRKNRQVSPHLSSAKIASDFRWRSHSPGSAYKIARCVAGLRSTMKQDRLNNCLLMHCHKSIADTLDTVKIAKRFACSNEQRKGHFGKFE